VLDGSPIFAVHSCHPERDWLYKETARNSGRVVLGVKIVPVEGTRQGRYGVQIQRNPRRTVREFSMTQSTGSQNSANSLDININCCDIKSSSCDVCSKPEKDDIF
jgi:hypothetical protein